VPAFHCEQKRQKYSLCGALIDAARVLVKYMDRKSSEDLPNPPQVTSRLGVSPGKAVDLRMKNLQQLCYLQSLYEDNILSDQELAEQKQIVLESLRKNTGTTQHICFKVPAVIGYTMWPYISDWLIIENAM